MTMNLNQKQKWKKIQKMWKKHVEVPDALVVVVSSLIRHDSNRPKWTALKMVASWSLK